MPEQASKVQIGFDTVVRVGRGETPEWTQIYGIESADVPSQPPEDIDVTHMQSPGRTRETMPGLRPVADYSMEKQYWPSDPGDVLLEELAGLTYEGNRELVLLEITPAGAPAAFTYSAYVNEFVPTSSLGEKQMANINWKVMGRVENATP